MTVYKPSTIKRRRSTAAEISDLRGALYNVVQHGRPMTVRQTFYRATVYGLIDKTEAEYRRVQRLLAEMRKAGQMPYGWIADNTRAVYQPDTFDGPGAAIKATARFYRKALWADADCRVEVWLEKDALSGVVQPVTEDFDVGLYVTRGFASLSFLHVAAEYIAAHDVPTFIYHLGDHDPSGVMAGEKIEATLRELAPSAEIRFKRLAVTRDQIDAWSLPSRPTKPSNHDRGWKGDSVELDAIEPQQLRDLVRKAIEQHLPTEQFRILKIAEESERAMLRQWADYATEGGDG